MPTGQDIYAPALPRWQATGRSPRGSLARFVTARAVPAGSGAPAMNRPDDAPAGFQQLQDTVRTFPSRAKVKETRAAKRQQWDGNSLPECHIRERNPSGTPVASNLAFAGNDPAVMFTPRTGLPAQTSERNSCKGVFGNPAAFVRASPVDKEFGDVKVLTLFLETVRSRRSLKPKAKLNSLGLINWRL